MNDLEKRWDTKHPQSVSKHVLRRSVETATLFSHSIGNPKRQLRAYSVEKSFSGEGHIKIRPYRAESNFGPGDIWIPALMV
jgi:hypothetical protein